MWAARMVLESTSHEVSCVATLTYKLAPRSVDPVEFRLFLDRFRKARGAFRYFGVGEYGDKTFRPHYHVAFFGVSLLEADTILSAWKAGAVHVDDMSPQAAAYVAGYVTKKMTMEDDSRLKGRHPEFSRMSRNPGLGALAAPIVASRLVKEFRDGRITLADVPKAMRLEGKLLPFGRYVRGKIRVGCGWSESMPNDEKVRLANEAGSLSVEEKALIEMRRIAHYNGVCARSKIQRSLKKL